MQAFAESTLGVYKMDLRFISYYEEPNGNLTSPF